MPRSSELRRARRRRPARRRRTAGPRAPSSASAGRCRHSRRGRRERRQSWRSSAGRPRPRASPTTTGASSRSSTVRVWWLMPRWRARRSVRGHPRARAASGSRARARCARSPAPDRPPWPSAEPEPRIPGPGPATAASQPSSVSPWCSAAAVVIDSPSAPPNAGPGREMTGEQPAVAQLAHDARVPARQRAAGGLHVAEPRSRPAACAKAQASGASWPCSASTATGRPSGSCGRPRGRRRRRPPRRAARRAAGSCS